MSTSPTTYTLLVDDQDTSVHYLCPSVKQQISGSFYNNTWTTVQGDLCRDGWFEYTFNATGISVAAAFAHTALYTVKIDDRAPEKLQGNGSYTSPQLEAGRQHKLVYALDDAHSQPPTFDYLAVQAAGPSAALEGRTVAVDDADASVKYTGSWSTRPSTTVVFDYATSLYRNTAHWTSNAGDSLEFKFSGSAVTVYGVLGNITSSANLTASYTLDGVSSTHSIPHGTLDTIPMINLFHKDISPGDHTLFINFTDIQKPTFLGIDLLTYTYASTASNQPVSDIAAQSSAKELGVGQIVGIILGISAAIALVLVLILKITRKKKQEVGSKVIEIHLCVDSERDVDMKTLRSA